MKHHMTKVYTRIILSFSILLVLAGGGFALTHAQETASRIVAFDFSAVAVKYVTGHSDWTVRIWDASTNQLLYLVQAPDLKQRSVSSALDGISKVIFSPSGDKIAVSFWGVLPNGQVTIIDVTTGKTILEISAPPIRVIDWSPDSSLLAGIYNLNPLTKGASYLAVWDATSGETINENRISNSASLSLDWHPSEPQLAYTNATNVVVWDITNWQELYTLPGDEIGVTSVAWSPSGDHLASVGSQGIIHIWNGKTGDLQTTITTSEVGRALPTVFWGVTDDLIGATIQKRIEVWNVNTGSLAFSDETSGPVNGIALKADGEIIYSSNTVETLTTTLPVLPKK